MANKRRREWWTVRWWLDAVGWRGQMKSPFIHHFDLFFLHILWLSFAMYLSFFSFSFIHKVIHSGSKKMKAGIHNPKNEKRKKEDYRWMFPVHCFSWAWESFIWKVLNKSWICEYFKRRFTSHSSNVEALPHTLCTNMQWKIARLRKFYY